jgi:hypothetical protein
MTYRIRYTDTDQAQQREARVEAASPTEALLKFKLICSEQASSSAGRVTSVTAEESEVFL